MAPPSITLRSATIVDTDFISRLVEITMRAYVEQVWGSFNGCTTCQAAREGIAKNNYSLIEYESRIIGALAVQRETTHIQLEQIYVLPEYQNCGVGTHLIRELASEAKAAGKPLRLRVLSVNPARKLYEREGFVVTASTPERYFMEKHA